MVGVDVEFLEVEPLAIGSREVLYVGVSEGESSVFQVAHAAETDGEVLCLDEALLRGAELAVADVAGLVLLDLYVLLLQHHPETVVHTNAVLF